MDKVSAKEELLSLVQEFKPRGKTTRDIPNRSLISVADKYCLGAREVMDLLDEVWSAA